MKRFGLVFTFFVLLLIPSIVSANVGIPVIGLSLPLMIVTLIPIIIIEAILIRAFLNVTSKRATAASVFANVVSTFIGMPLAWGLLYVFEIIVLSGLLSGCVGGPDASWFGRYILPSLIQTAWLCPDEPALPILIPIAVIIIFIVAFFFSVFFEYQVVKRFMKTKPASLVKQVVWRMNFYTYFLLIMIVLGIAILVPW